MPKIWEIFPKIQSNFINKHPEYNRVVLQLLFNRNIIEKKEIKEFLNPDYHNLLDPFLFNDMDKSVNLIIQHIKKHNKIAVYGDYDADGVTASAVLVKILTILKADTEVYLPDRKTEGYGLNKKAIKELAQKNIKLIITVDAGICNKTEVEYAKSLDIDVIITDHHIPPKQEKLPKCLTINAHNKNEKYSFKFLAGVGVAFKLAKAIINKSTLTDEIKQKLENSMLDLIAIGTITDCVSLLGENRILVKHGLKKLNKTKKTGLTELIKLIQNNNKTLDTWNVGFQIAPRLNAAGRMDHANTAFELLITKNQEEAAFLANRLNDKNIDRQKITEQIVREIEKQADVQKDNKIIIGVCPFEEQESKTWNEGVIGLAAGRICDRYYKPTLIITKDENNNLKGSGRSIEEFDIREALEQCNDFLSNYGGHPGACGFSLLPENLEKFSLQIKKLAKKRLAKINLQPKLKIECELNINEINEDLINQINKCAPFGQNNPRPIFISKKVCISKIVNMGVNGNHIKFRINGLWALAFGEAEKWKDLQIGNYVDVVYYAEMNEFNGTRESQVRVIDMRNAHNA